MFFASVSEFFLLTDEAEVLIGDLDDKILPEQFETSRLVEKIPLRLRQGLESNVVSGTS